MKRREILKYTAYLTGAAISAPLVSVILSGCKTDATADIAVDSGLHFFNQEEFKLVKTVVDLILPKTDSPSASEVGVHNMIDHMVGLVYPKESQSSFKSGFTSFAKYLNEAGSGKGILKLEAGEQLNVLQQLTQSTGENEKIARETFLDLKQQTVAYYLTTEEIGTKYLNYLPVPGKYESCISLEEVGGKAWAL